MCCYAHAAPRYHPWMQHPIKTVYGSLMHHRAELSALGEAVHAKPYGAPPRAPVLYIKPSNTFSAFGATLQIPAKEVLARGCLGLIFMQKQSISRVEHAGAAPFLIADLSPTLGFEFALFCDFSIPHSSFFRPPVKFNAFDGSLGFAQNSASTFDLNDLEISTWINGQQAHRYSTRDYLSPALEHAHAVASFIDFQAGDVLMLGCPPDAPLVRAGDVVEIKAANLPSTRQTITTVKGAAL